MDKGSTIQHRTPYVGARHVPGAPEEDFHTFMGFWFRSVQTMHLALAKAMSKARIAHWTESWMAQDESGDILLYDRRPYVLNSSLPSRRQWVAKEENMDEPPIAVLPKAMGDTQCPDWMNAVTPKVARFNDELMYYMAHNNRKAEALLNQYKQQHPFAVAMTKLQSRRSRA